MGCCQSRAKYSRNSAASQGSTGREALIKPVTFDPPAAEEERALVRQAPQQQCQPLQQTALQQPPPTPTKRVRLAKGRKPSIELSSESRFSGCGPCCISPELLASALRRSFVGSHVADVARSLSRSLTPMSCRPVAGERSRPRQVESFRDLAAALKAFRVEGEVAIFQASGGATREALWAPACSFIEQMLLGVQAHLPAVSVSAELLKCSPRALEDGDEIAPALTIRFPSAPLIGEFATRSRICSMLRLEETVRLSLSKVSSSLEGPLILEVEGISFPPLPESAMLRKLIQLKAASQGKEFDKEVVWKWFEQNKHTVVPLQDSKLHRSVECLLGLKAIQMGTTEKQRHDIPWGFLHSPHLVVSAFKFHMDAKGGIQIAADRAVSTDPEVASFDKLCTDMGQDTICRHGKQMEVLAASSINFMRLFFGEGVGGPAASLAKITKLVSAASFWGPATSGWQQSDNTWTCMDEKDWLGRVVKEQGRVIWHQPAPGHELLVGPSGLRDALAAAEAAAA